ncbi:MAG: serine/threonine protein kinase [Blastopirellula sp.]|nr:MAG: serine/threonine protein kinase [Blastopirellula sp.]
MAKVTSEKFLDLVVRSKLLSEDQVQQAEQALRQQYDGQLPMNLQLVVDYFVQQQLITSWHCEKLTAGKYRGFFLAKYKLLKLLGTGGMSSVYLAEHTVMQRKVAIKVLPPKRVKDATYLARFQMEAQATAQLDHPNIVRAFDIDKEENTHYIVMEYVPGRNLQAIVRDTGPLSFDQAAQCIAQAADGLQHMHDAGVVHRDIKPANLLFDPAGMIKILDMGLARFSQDDEESLTMEHEEHILGTADYLSPEQAMNSHRVDARTDIYSLGCTLYFLLVGHVPFPEGSLAQRIAKHQSVMPEKIRKSRPNCPASLANICEKMMEKKRTERFQSAKQVAHELRNWLETRGRMPINHPTTVKQVTVSVDIDKSLPRAESISMDEGHSEGKLTLPRAEPLSDIELGADHVQEYDMGSQGSLITGDSYLQLDGSSSASTAKPALPQAVPLTAEEEKALDLEIKKHRQAATEKEQPDLKSAVKPEKKPILLWTVIGVAVLVVIVFLFYLGLAD